MLLNGKEWKLVPVELTEEMRLAFWLEWKTVHSQGDGQLFPSYLAMLDAAPAPPETIEAARDGMATIPQSAAIEILEGLRISVLALAWASQKIQALKTDYQNLSALLDKYSNLSAAIKAGGQDG